MGAGIGIGIGPGGINVSGGVNIGGVGVGVSISAPAPSYVVPFANWTPALFLPHQRSIGGIYAQITIDEQHTDEVQITDHPVEAGAPISDHAFARPQQVSIQAAWSRATAYDLSAESGVYGLLLSLQTRFQPFDIFTGKRHYQNMLIERLVVTTDNQNEYTLMAQITCRQVIIVSTTTTATPASQSASPAQQKDPEGTSPPKQKGDQPTVAPNSVAGDAAQQQADKDDAAAGNLASKGIVLGDTTGPGGGSQAF